MPRRTGAAAGVLLAALTAVALSGCSAPTPTAAETATSEKATVKPTVTPAPLASVTPTPTDDPNACAGRSSMSIIGYSEGDEEPTYHVTWNGREFVDNGPRKFARGTVTTSPEGRITYTVAEGDAPLAIGDRLCIYVYEYMNFLHLGGAGGLLHPGDVFTIPQGMKPLHGEPSTPRP